MFIKIYLNKFCIKNHMEVFLYVLKSLSDTAIEYNENK